MNPVTLYAVLKLGVDVFVLEQGSPLPGVGRQGYQPGAIMLWVEENGKVLASLRLLVESDGYRIGRVATVATARGRGLAGELMGQAVRLCNGAKIVLDAQEQLAHWYGNFGFVRSGESFLEDEIPHVPMTRASA